jgi:hypothetical protein
MPTDERLCGTCGLTFWAPSTRTVTRCPACRSIGRATCGRCGGEVKIKPGASGFVICDLCRARGWRQWERPRAAGITKTCTVCGDPFLTYPSRETTERRCPSCVASGRNRCAACGEPITVGSGAGSRPRCEACKTPVPIGPMFGLVRHGPGRRRAARITLSCRGAEEFGSVQHAHHCWGDRTMTEYQASRLRTYRADRTYECKPCQGLHRIADLARRRAADPNMASQFLWLNGADASVAVDEVALDADALRVEAFAQTLKALAPGGRVRSWEQMRAVNAAWMSVRLRGRPRGRPSPQAGHRAAAAARARRERLNVRVNTINRSWRVTAGKWRAGVNVEIRACRLCSTLLLVSLAPGAQQPEMHQRCMVDLMRSDPARRWLSRRRLLRDAETDKVEIDSQTLARMPMRPRAGRPADPVILTRNFRWAVLYYLGDDKQADLARAAGVSTAVVSEAIRRTLIALPQDDPQRPFADKRFAPLVAMLRNAAVQRDGPMDEFAAEG